jgi:hypothetical protein
LTLSAPEEEVWLADEELPDLVPEAKPDVAAASELVLVVEAAAVEEACPKVVVLP